MQEHKETCLEINSTQSEKLRSSKFKHHCKQLNIIFKIYADFGSLLKGVQSNDRNNNTLYNEKYQKHIVCVDDKLSKPVVLYRRKNAVNKSIEKILKGYDYCKKKRKKEKKIIFIRIQLCLHSPQPTHTLPPAPPSPPPPPLWVMGKGRTGV